MTVGLLAQATSGGDPLYTGDIDTAVVLITILKVVVCFAFLLIATMLMVWFERKVIAGMQNRVGPNKAGPFGVLQTLADGIKAFFKERINPERYGGAPLLGLKGNILKAHGSSNRHAIVSAIRAASRIIRADMNQRIEADIARANDLLTVPVA